MARARSSCRDDAYASYIVEPLIRDISDELRTALEQLAEVLNTVDRPVSDIVEELTTRDVLHALSTLPIRARQHVLEPLGIHLVPKTLSQGLCRDVVGRLQRAEEPTARHAAFHLTAGTLASSLHTLAVRSMTTAGGPDEHSADQVDDEFESRWTPALLRLAVWSAITQNEISAHVWTWAIERPWFIHGTIDTSTAAKIRTAAEQVIAHSAHRDAVFEVHDGMPDDQPAATSDSPGQPVAAPDDSRISPVSRTSPESMPVAVASNVRPAAPQTSPAATPDSLADAEQALHAARECFALAVVSAEHILADLRTGRGPADNDVFAVRAAQSTYSHVCSAVPEAGGEDPRAASDKRPTLDDIAQMLTVRAARDADAPLRQSIAAAVGIASDAPGISEHVARLRTLTAELLAAHDWTDAQRALALAIAALVDLVRSPQAAPDARLELQARISGAVASLPALAVLSMLADQLTFEAPCSGTTSPSGQDPQSTSGQEPTATAAAPPLALAADVSAHQVPAAADPTDTADVSVPAEASEPAQTSAEPTPPQPDLQPAHDGPVAAADPAAQVPDEPMSTATPTAPREPEPTATSTTAQTSSVLTQPGSHPSRATAALHITAERSANQSGTEQYAPTPADVQRAITELLSTCRYGMASHLAVRAEWNDTRIRTFRMAGLAQAVRSDMGPCGAMLRQELADLDSNQVAEDNVSLLIAVSSLVRVALVTGEPTAGALLGELSIRLDPHLAAIADEIGRRALRGVLHATPALNVLANVSDAERELKLIIERAGAARRPRTLRFKRCSDVAKRWLDSNGVLGQLLDIVVANEADRLVEVQTKVQHLSDASVRERQIDELDAHFRGHSGKPVEGSGRQDLHALILETLRPVRTWIELTSALTRSRVGRDEWTTGEVADMRSAVLAQRDAALAALLAQTQTGDSLLVAAAQAAHASLQHTLTMLDGFEPLQAGEPRVTVALDLELLKADDVFVTDAGTLELRSTDPLPALIAAVPRDWTEAFTLQLERENFPAAQYMLEMQDAGILADDALDDDARGRYTMALERSRAEMVAERNSVDTDLRRARRSNVVTEGVDGELTAMLASADPTRNNLGQVRATLATISNLLPTYREQAAQRLRDRLAALNIDDEERARISDPIEKGDLLTAEELLYFQDVGEPVPRTDHSRRDLRAFFPAIPDALSKGITTELVTAVRERTSYAGSDVLDYSHLSPDAAEQIAEALGAWRQAATAPVAGRRNFTERDLLLPAIRLMGYECSKIRRLDDMPKSGERRFIEITDVRPNRDAQIPAFGSKLGGRLRVLLVWGQPTEDVLTTYVDHDQSGDSLLIAHFGTMSAAARAKFAARVERTGGPVAILDDAALAYLAARGNRQLGVAMSILMPFAAVNPYIRMKRGAVAEEMFYGRDLERVQVIDPDGTQVLYGGRGLGKSALLRYAAEKFESSEPGQRIAIYLSLDSVAAGAAFSKDALWVGLRNELIKREVLPTPTGKAKKTGDVYDHVRAGMLDWRNKDSRNRLLILLDESDQFFEADAPAFLDTKRLRDIGVVTDNNIKVVFAGLHSVQRYAKSARNGPFSHLAQRPTVIGPLRPQFAADLLTVPLGVLGYEFADDNLVNRALGYCSYQPFLLQMFGHRLVEALHAKRRDGLDADQPPYMITDDDVAVVERNRDLRADITSAFQDTLNLDPRYNVIANVLADHAFRFGFDARLQDAELREECLSWWRAGFESLDSESFRAYLNEMDGLGVVAPNTDGRGWRLRSPNVLNMIGNRSEVERQLLMAESESVPEAFLALEGRPQLSDSSSAPLTAAQLDDILGDHSTHVRVVVGSRATGLDRVDEALREVTSKAGDFDIPPINGRRAFEEELRGGRAGQRRVIIDDLASVQPQASACLEALDLAFKHVPTAPGVTRAAVLISSPEQAELWDSAFKHGVAVALRRYDQQTLRVWTITRQMFSHDERLQRLWDLTGGWPMLVEHAATLADREGGQEPTALDELEAYVNSPAGHSELLDGVGLSRDPDLARAYASIVALVDDQKVSRADLQMAADMDSSARDVVERLMALQVFDTHSDSSYSVEPRLLSAWQALLT